MRGIDGLEMHLIRRRLRAIKRLKNEVRLYERQLDLAGREQLGGMAPNGFGVVVGMANGVDLNDLIGSNSEIFGNIVLAKLAEITGESYETVSNVCHEAPMNSDFIGEDELRLI